MKRGMSKETAKRLSKMICEMPDMMAVATGTPGVYDWTITASRVTFSDDGKPHAERLFTTSDSAELRRLVLYWRIRLAAKPVAAA